MSRYYPKHPTYFTNVGSSFMPPAQVMVPGQYLLSPDKKYKLLLQEDANLAIFDQATGAAVWIADSNQPYSTSGPGSDFPLHVLMWGGLYLYDPIRGRTWYTWDNTTDAEAGRYFLSLQNDANLVIVDIQALWSTNTSATFTPAAATATVLNPNQDMVVAAVYPAGEYKLIFQADGNLVVYDKDMKATWNSGTHNTGATRAVMQSDGNFVIYDGAGKAVWHTSTYGHPGAYAQIQENGAFVIVKNVPIWARFGWAPEPVKPPRAVFYPDHSTGPFPLFGGIGWDFN